MLGLRRITPNAVSAAIPRFNRFAHALFEHGVYLSPLPALHSVLSTAHDEGHVAQILGAAEKALADPAL